VFGKAGVGDVKEHEGARKQWSAGEKCVDAGAEHRCEVWSLMEKAKVEGESSGVGGAQPKPWRNFVKRWEKRFFSLS